MANAKKKQDTGKTSEEREPSPKDDGSADFGDNIRLGPEAKTLMTRAGGAGVLLLVAGVALGAAQGDGFRQFFHSYLVAFMWAIARQCSTPA